jgi:hypothetical protein
VGPHQAQQFIQGYHPGEIESVEKGGKGEGGGITGLCPFSQNPFSTVAHETWAHQKS